MFNADTVSGFVGIDELSFMGCGFTLVSRLMLRALGARASFPGWPVCRISRGCCCMLVVREIKFMIFERYLGRRRGSSEGIVGFSTAVSNPSSGHFLNVCNVGREREQWYKLTPDCDDRTTFPLDSYV